MDISDESFDSLMEILYQTLEDSTAWTKFYHSVGKAVDVDIVHMLGIDKTHGALSYSDGTNMPAHGGKWQVRIVLINFAPYPIEMQAMAAIEYSDYLTISK
jgi:hypothetical protein